MQDGAIDILCKGDILVNFKLLLIGPLPPPLGGATVLFELLVRELKAHKNYEYMIINTNVNKSNLISVFRLITDIYRHAIKADIINLHASYRGVLVLAPFVYFITRFLRKKLIFRLFGGDFYEHYQRANVIRRFLFDKVLFKADLVLFETQALVRQFYRHGNLKWFPNHRPMDPNLKKAAEPGECLKVAFISHIRKEKGIFELIEASDRLPDVTFDVYGPFYDGLTESIFEGRNINYCGIVEQLDVRNVLRQYDALILPSYKEGYPGIIIEAFTAGAAVICTNLNTLQEMVTAGEEAILVSPRSYEDIVKAVSMLNEDRNLLMKLKNNSLKKAEMFDSQFWTQKYLSFCQEVMTGCK